MSVLTRFEKVRRESSFDKQAELDEIVRDAKGYRENLAERVLSVDQVYALDKNGNSKGVQRFTWGLRLFAFVLSVIGKRGRIYYLEVATFIRACHSLRN